tara:strand:+ start:910 stop:1068 length:159 start_codon:yes stop_codon:yes gene_type:complete
MNKIVITNDSTNKNTLDITLLTAGITTTLICPPFYFCKVNRSNKEIVFKKVN